MPKPNPEPGPREAARRELDEAVSYDAKRHRALLAQLAGLSIKDAQKLGF